MKQTLSKVLKLSALLGGVCLSTAALAGGLETLPPCAGGNPGAWDNCVGETSVEGESFRGVFRNGRRAGEGRLVARDGSVYTGEFVDDKKEGLGIIRLPNGEAYAGEFQNDFLHGAGAYFWPNGDRYFGDFAANARSGLGVFSSPYAEPKMGEFGNNDYLGAPKRPPQSGEELAPPKEDMMGARGHSLGVREMAALSLSFVLVLFLLDCALFPPLDRQLVEAIGRRNRGAWFFLIVTMLFCGAALAAGGQILLFGNSPDAGARKSPAPTEAAEAAPM